MDGEVAPNIRMHTVTVMPIANGANTPADPRTAVCTTVLTRKKVPIASRTKAPP